MVISAPRQRSLDRITMGTGLAVVVVGLLVLVGWALGVDWLLSVVPSQVSMKANTAVCFVLSGLAISLMPLQAARWVRISLPLAVLAIVDITMLEYLTGWSAGIDEWLVRDPFSREIGLPPGRMAFATTLAFTSSSVAILLVEWSWLTTAQYVAASAFLIAFISLLAYLFGERNMTFLSQYTSLAVHTAVGLCLLNIGILTRCVATGPIRIFSADDAGGASLRRLLPWSIVALLGLSFLSALGVRFELYTFALALVFCGIAASMILALAIWSNSTTLSRAEGNRRRDLERYRLTLTSIGDAVIATDGHGRVTFLNEIAVSLTGWTLDDATGQPLESVFRIINEATRLPVANPVAQVLATGNIVGLANHTILVALDATERPIEDSAAPIKADDGSVEGVVLVFRDVTAKQRSNRMLTEQTHVLELIAQGKPLGEVLNALCLLIEGQAEHPLLASIILADEGRADWTLGAGPSLPPEYEQAVEAVAIAHGVASCGPESRLGAPVYIPLIANDPLWANFAKLAREHNFRDSWTCPILSSRNEVLGIYAQFRRDPREPSPEELRFVEVVTRTAGIAIDRDRNKADLIDARTRLEIALSAGSIGTWSWDLTRDWIVPDAQIAQLYALKPEDLAGSSPAPYLKAIHRDDVARVEQAIGDAIAGDGKYWAEFRIVQPGGSSLAVEARGQVQYAPDGRPLALPGVVLDISDRKRVEEEKGQLALLVENSGEFIGIATLDGMPTYVNNTARRMMGIDDWETARQTPLREYFFPEDHAYILDEFLPQVRAEGYARTEIRLRQFKTGAAIWIDYGVTLLRSWEGAPVGYATISRDLTEQRQVDAERRTMAAHVEAQARLFDSMLSNLPDHVFTLNLASRLTYANKVLLELWGKSADEVVGRNFYDLDYPIDLANRVHREIGQVIALNQRVSGETPFTAVGGSGYFEYILSPVLAPDGSVEAVVGSSRNVTERKLAEEATKLRAARLQKLAEISARINAAHDVNSVIRVVSREALDLFGAGRAAISMVLTPDFPQPINVISTAGEAVDRIDVAPPGLDPAALSQALNQTTEPLRLNRDEVEANATMSNLSRLGGDLAIERGWLAAPLVARDRKTMGLIQLADKLSGDFTPDDEALLVQLSLLATIAIENARLYEELRGNDQRKDEFLAMLAHELRNPLAAISNAVKLLARLGIGTHGDWSMDVITRQMIHLTRLIDDLLDVSRISQGKITLRRDLIEATPILESASATVRGLVEERKHTLEVSIDRGNLWLSADATRLEQVVVNLLNNAAKYSENSGKIRLEARNEAGQVVIQVIDQGVGIPPEKLPQMFELFAQGDRSLARSEGGLGIGLTVVKKLVEMHGGTINARSEGLGHGSEFTIRLPSVPRPTQVQPTPATTNLIASPAIEVRKARILVVDDNVDTARGMARLLKLIGHTISTAHSGPEAIEVARQQHPEIVLLDIGLPGMSGYEVAARLRQEEACQGALIIAVSGYGQDEDRRRSREAGFDHHLIKPLDHDALLALLASPS